MVNVRQGNDSDKVPHHVHLNYHDCCKIYTLMPNILDFPHI